MHQLATSSISPNTLSTYYYMWRDWEHWAKENNTPSLPALPQALAQFFTSRGAIDAQKNLSSSNMRMRFAAINFYHRLCNFIPPTNTYPILQQLRRSFIRQLGSRKIAKAALSRHHILEFERTYGQITLGQYHTPVEMRNSVYVSIFAFMFEATLRYDDVISPLYSDIVWSEDSIRIFLVDTKTDQERQGQWAAIIADLEISTAYRYFLKILQVIFGTWLLAPPEFKAMYLKRHKLHLSDNFPLEHIHLAARWEPFEITTPKPFRAWLPVPYETVSYKELLQTIKTWSTTLGFKAVDIGTHSLRRGGCSEDALLRLPDTLTLKNGRWKSKASPAIYTETTAHIEARLKALREHPNLYTKR